MLLLIGSWVFGRLISTDQYPKKRDQYKQTSQINYYYSFSD